MGYKYQQKLEEDKARRYWTSKPPWAYRLVRWTKVTLFILTTAMMLLDTFLPFFAFIC